MAAGVLFRVTVDLPAQEAERSAFMDDLEVAEVLLQALPPELPEQELAWELADLLGHRITLIRPDGVVLADSGIPGGDVTGVENHGDRSEVQQALEGRRAMVERRSSTTGIPSLYAAARVQRAGTRLVLRLARPVDPLHGPIRSTATILAGAGVAGLLLLWIGGLWIGTRFEGALQRLLEQTRRMAEGDFQPSSLRARVPPDLDELAVALVRLGEGMEDRFRGVAREKEEMQTLIDSIAEGVLALTQDARVLRMNRAAARILEVGRPAGFAPVGTLVRHPELRDHLEESVLMQVPTREVRLGGRDLLVSAHRLDEGGSVVTFLDVTELRRMEEVRRDFVANASHELKTPLTAMRGFAETLLEGEPPPKLRDQFLRSIRENTVRMQNLVDDLLDLSRLETGSWTVQEEEVEVGALAAEVWGELQDQRPDRTVDFKVEGDAVVLADGQALQQIFRNLFQNALRYTPDDGSIRVRIYREGPEARVEVTDSGTGIPSSALPRIFERFYRVDSGRDRSEGGTGLGLAIVRHLVNTMGGEVGAESQLGEGTTIRFTLPLVE